MPYNNNMSGRSVRQIVKVSIGGKQLRLELSNELSTEPVVIRSVYIAHATDSFAIVPQTVKYLLFNGQTQVTIPAGKRVVSDALSFDLQPLEKVAITMNYGRAPAVPTVHMGSRTTSYILKGVSTARSNFAPSFRENHWFNIASIAVFDLTAKAIGIIGNSITDGKGTTDNANNRWTDVLAEQLQKRHGVTTRGILNLGIGNNRVTVAGGFGVLTKQRFNRDILMQPGIETVVIFEGINDIGAASKGASERVAADLINAYDEMIAKAKARNLRIFLCTITPFKGAVLHALLTLQNPQYKKFHIKGTYPSGATVDVNLNNNTVTAMSKTLIELDPSYSFAQWRVWLSFRYFSKQYINKTNTLHFNGHWESFGGINYALNSKVNFALNVVNIFNQSGATGSISAADLVTDTSSYKNYLMSGSYIRPFEVSLSTTINF